MRLVALHFEITRANNKNDLDRRSSERLSGCVCSMCRWTLLPAQLNQDKDRDGS